jgi:GNAT superfamily N-acetyltransferase
VTTPAWRIVPLDPAWDRRAFTSGSSALDRYFHQQVTQDIRRRVTACFVAVEEPGPQLIGYYTLASASIALGDLPLALAQRLPRYPSVPAVRLGRLAVDQTCQGRGLGGILLADALARALRADIAAYALLVDAKDAAAAAFYQHHGFLALASQPLTLFLPLATAQALL